MPKAVIFPGQGAQYKGMGRKLYENFTKAKDMFARAESAAGFALRQVCFNDEDKLANTYYQQIAIFVVSAIAWDVFKSEAAIEPQFCAGLSLGEYNALYAAEVFGFEEGILLVKERAQAMEQAAQINRSFMLALIGIDAQDLEQYKELPFYIANLNCPQQVVVSALEKNRAEVMRFLEGIGNIKRIVELKVSGGFHSPFMQPAAGRLKEALDKTEFNNAKYPIVCNVDAKAYTEKNHLKENLVKQLCGSVLWQKSIEYMAEKGVEEFFEIGPGKVLKGLLRKINKSFRVVNFSGEEEIKAIV
jgi:[acyl-carrier-protein] S-malonyltransferase